MDIRSGIQKAVEPFPTSLPSSPQQSGAHQQSEPEDSQADRSARPTADNHSKDTQPAAGHRDDKKYFSVESIDGTMFHEAIRRLLLTERRLCFSTLSLSDGLSPPPCNKYSKCECEGWHPEPGMVWLDSKRVHLKCENCSRGLSGETLSHPRLQMERRRSLS